jgi:hypothetical protein
MVVGVAVGTNVGVALGWGWGVSVTIVSGVAAGKRGTIRVLVGVGVAAGLPGRQPKASNPTSPIRAKRAKNRRRLAIYLLAIAACSSLSWS